MTSRPTETGRSEALTAPVRDSGARGALPFAAAAYILFVLTVGTNMPTPLYARYQAEFGFTPIVVTLVFAVYAGTLVPTLLMSGALADSIGHRRVVVPAIALAGVAAALFAAADGVGSLFAARALQGISVGAASSALTAALVETEPSGNRPRASSLASAMVTGGGGLGPVLAGLLAQYAPLPLRLAYLLELGLLALAMAAVTQLPAPTGPRPAWRPRRPSIPAAARRQFALAGAVSFLGWAVVALFLAMVPSYTSVILHRDNLLLSGTAAGMFLLCAALAQYVLSRTGTVARPAVGLLLLVAGLALLAAAGATRLTPLLLAAAVVGGTGQGIAFMAALARTNELAPPESRAEVLSAFYMITYLGVGIPVIGVGFLAAEVGLFPAVVAFSALTGVACLAVATAARTQPDPPSPRPA
ncbi:MFS transporter [Streptomyces sp. NPDC054796]